MNQCVTHQRPLSSHPVSLSEHNNVLDHYTPHSLCRRSLVLFFLGGVWQNHFFFRILLLLHIHCRSRTTVSRSESTSMCEFSNRISFYKILLSIFLMSMSELLFLRYSILKFWRRGQWLPNILAVCLVGWLAGRAIFFVLFCMQTDKKKHFFSQSVPCGGECDHYDDYGWRGRWGRVIRSPITNVNISWEGNKRNYLLIGWRYRMRCISLSSHTTSMGI